MNSTRCNVADLPHQTFKRVFERPFSSDTKTMAVSGTHINAGPANANTSHLNGSGREVYYVKGSIDALLPRCKFYHVADGSTPPLDPKVRSGIASKAHVAAARGLRVIAMAYGSADAPLPSRPASPSLNNTTDQEKSAHLVIAGFVAMYDPPRKGVADAVALLQSGGVHVVMITGDAEETALSIAKSLGLRGATNPNACLTGAALDRMNAAQLSERVGSVSVFARVSPKHKMAIVEAFQARGAIVAMTGDGGK
jgi:Ca2+-transporting ATPase